MSKRKPKVLLEIHNDTRLLLFVTCYYRRRGKRGYVAALYVFDRPPDSPAYNNSKLQKVEPGKMYAWDISLTDKWVLRNNTRYKPLQYKDFFVKEKSDGKFVVIILPTNNHISLDDQKIL